MRYLTESFNFALFTLLLVSYLFARSIPQEAAYSQASIDQVTALATKSDDYLTKLQYRGKHDQ